MSEVRASLLQQALDVFEQMPLDEQETLAELVQRRVSDRRRAQLACDARATLRAAREGRAKYGTIEDLERDLLAEP